MKEVKIETPLRVIVLQYDETKPEKPYEKELLEKYVALHLTWFNIIKDIPRLKYEYAELNDQIEQATRVFQPLKQQIENLHQKAEGYAGSLTNDNWEVEVMEELTAISESINEYHELLTPIFDEHNRLIAEVSKMDNADEAFTETHWSDYRDFVHELYKNYDDYSLDMVSFDEDDNNLREKFSECRSFSDDSEKDNALFDELNELVKDAYDTFNTIKEIVAIKHRNTGLMDSEISDSCARGELPEDKMPKYFIPAGDKKIEEFKVNYSLLASNENHTLHLTVSDELVEDGDIGMPTELILSLQHFPKLIHKMIFAIDFKFESEYGNEITAAEWKGRDRYIKYISSLKTLPFSIFFFQDQDVRGYILFGDMLLNKEAVPTTDGMVQFEGEAINKITNRMFHTCWTFMLYCYNTGFDPEDYILALLADFDLPITYEQVKEKFEADIKAGIQVRVGPPDSESSL